MVLITAVKRAVRRLRNRRFLAFAALLVLSVAATLITLAVRATHRPPAAAATVDLEEHIRGYIRHFPSDHEYRIPDAAERALVSEGITDIVDGRLDAAREPLSEAGYTVRTVRLAGSHRMVAQVAEATGQRVQPRGWGEVFVDLSRRVQWSAQVPHPVSDQHTELLGAELFSRSPGGVLVLAGATRDSGRGNSADVAHRQDSVFNAVCAALAARRIPGIQVHGFADDSSPGSDVVVSAGPAEAGPRVREAARPLSSAGFTVCRAWDQDCGRLEGTTNVQAGTAAASGVPFLHIENSRSVRDSRTVRARLAAALAEVTGRLAKGGGPPQPENMERPEPG
ncbi:hypothetical protein [Streptomyces sioyaensis]|uniref:hypothetical protein n=1 Tax=Streptomyces sioyaensis TaxID=67364 RepID=UPI00371BD08F